MKQLKLHIYNLPPLPRNSATINAGGRTILTEMAREFKVDLRHRLKYQFDQEAFAEFKKEFMTKKWNLTLHIIVKTPTDRLFTKTGELSENSIDLDAHKHLIDVVTQHLGIDDSQARVLIVEKEESLDEFWNWEITLGLREKLIKRVT